MAWFNDLIAHSPAAGTKAEPVDQKAVAMLREQGLQHSQVMEHLSWMCDVYGPRLTGSPNLARAQDWAVKTFAGFGLADARKEAWGPFGRGWSLEHVSMHVVGENPWPVIAYAKAWSPSLPGRVEAEVVHVADLNADALEAMDLTGKVVLLDSTRTVSEPFDATAHRLDATELLGLADSVAVPASLPGQARPRPTFAAKCNAAGRSCRSWSTRSRWRSSTAAARVTTARSSWAARRHSATPASACARRRRRRQR